MLYILHLHNSHCTHCAAIHIAQQYTLRSNTHTLAHSSNVQGLMLYNLARLPMPDPAATAILAFYLMQNAQQFFALGLLQSLLHRETH